MPGLSRAVSNWTVAWPSPRGTASSVWPSSVLVAEKSAGSRDRSTSKPYAWAASIASLRPRVSPSTASRTPCASSAASFCLDEVSNARRCACTRSDAPSATNATGATTAASSLRRTRAMPRLRASSSSMASREAATGTSSSTCATDARIITYAGSAATLAIVSERSASSTCV